MSILNQLYTAERASELSASDNVVFQRQLFAYHWARNQIRGRVLEIGCGEGYGTRLLAEKADELVAIDKFVPGNKENFAKVHFIQMEVPDLKGFDDNSFDCIVCFQLIEHVEDDKRLLTEIYRVLRPGGKLYLTTPNLEMTLTRNPYHVREYTAAPFRALFEAVFSPSKIQYLGLYGDQKVMEYYEKNKASVAKIKRLDIFNLEYRLPRRWFQLPYDLLNRINRLRLIRKNNTLVSGISTSNYMLKPMDGKHLDFYCIAEK